MQELSQVSQLIGLSASLIALMAALVCLISAAFVLLIVSRLSSRLLKPAKSAIKAVSQPEPEPVPEGGCPNCRAVVDPKLTKITGVKSKDGKASVEVVCNACHKTFDLPNEQAQQLLQPTS